MIYTPGKDGAASLNSVVENAGSASMTSKRGIIKA
jgi:hypothetical protein